MEKSYKRLPLFVPLIACLMLFHVIAHAETRPTLDKKRDILKLLEVSGLLAQMDYIKEGATNSYVRVISLTYPQVPSSFWDEFNKLVGKEEMDVLMDRVVLVYNKHMSHDVIKQLIKMFSTLFWEEWKQKMPAISKEAGLIGSQWTQEFSQSEKLKHKLDNLVKKYDLEKLNSKPSTAHVKEEFKQ